MMSRSFFLILLLLLAGLSNAQPVLNRIEDFGEDPGNLKMYVHLPENIEDSSNVPLLVALHGCNQNADEIAQRSGWNKLSDRKGFIVLYPQQRFINNTSSCFNWFKKKDTGKEGGEPASIRNMVRYMIQHYPIDTTRIHLYGVSAGGAMGSALLACYPEMFKSGAIYAGGPYRNGMNPLLAFFAMSGPNDQTPEEWGAYVEKANPSYQGNYPNLIVVHGKDDKIVNPKNSKELVDQWSYLHDIDPKPDTILREFKEVPEVTKMLYQNEKGETVIIRYIIDRLGHKIAIDPGEGEKEGGETNLFAKDMGFHSTYWIGIDLGLYTQ